MGQRLIISEQEKNRIRNKHKKAIIEQFKDVPPSLSNKERITITKDQMDMLHKNGYCACGDYLLIYDENNTKNKNNASLYEQSVPKQVTDLFDYIYDYMDERGVFKKTEEMQDMISKLPGNVKTEVEKIVDEAAFMYDNISNMDFDDIKDEVKKQLGKIENKLSGMVSSYKL